MSHFISTVLACVGLASLRSIPMPIHLLIMQIKRFFLYQLPPRRFWAFLLSGGFNVTDLIVVSFHMEAMASPTAVLQDCNVLALTCWWSWQVVLWCSVNAVWLYLGFDTRWKGNYLAKFHSGYRMTAIMHTSPSEIWKWQIAATAAAPIIAADNVWS